MLYLNFVSISDTLSEASPQEKNVEWLPVHSFFLCFKMDDFKPLKSENLHSQRNCNMKSKK